LFADNPPIHIFRIITGPYVNRARAPERNCGVFTTAELATEPMTRNISDDGFVELYQSQYNSLVGLARLLLRDRAAADDAVQEAFINVFRGRRRVRADGARAYLRTCVVNECRSAVRKDKRRSKLLPWLRLAEERTFDEHDIDDERSAAVIGALASLSQRQRECVALRYWLDMSDAAIASTLGVSPGSVKTHFHRALPALKEALGDFREAI
jgi:RNA polymerase sigma-70 factor (sigma-E family)